MEKDVIVFANQLFIAHCTKFKRETTGGEKNREEERLRRFSTKVGGLTTERERDASEGKDESGIACCWHCRRP